MKRLFICLASVICCNIAAQDVMGERLAGDVMYYEEEVYSLVFIRLNYGAEQTVQTLKRATSLRVHEFDADGHETEMSEYTQRDANMGSIAADGSSANENEIRRVSPARTVTYGQDWIKKGQDTLKKEILDRHGSFRLSDGSTYKFDSDHFLVRFTDSEGITVKYSYNERGHLVRTVTEWNDASSATVTYDTYIYDGYGNWTSRIRNEKRPGETPRPVAIEERRYRYSSGSDN